jgi:hypothetical protein
MRMEIIGAKSIPQIVPDKLDAMDLGRASQLNSLSIGLTQFVGGWGVWAAVGRPNTPNFPLTSIGLIFTA